MPMIPAPKFNDLSPTGQRILPNLEQSAPEPSPNQATIGQSDFKYNQFDAPVPGQSLTETPRNAKWEHPPQIANPRDAIDMVYKSIMKPNNIKQTIILLKNNIPVEAVARTILMAGFQEGKWTPDVALLIAKPVTAIIAAIGKKAGVENLKLKMPKDPKDDPSVKLNTLFKQIKGPSTSNDRKSKKEKFLNSFVSK